MISILDSPVAANLALQKGFLLFVLGPWFVMQYFVSFLVLQSSRWGREGWLLYFNCLLGIMWLLLFCDSSS